MSDLYRFDPSAIGSVPKPVREWVNKRLVRVEHVGTLTVTDDDTHGRQVTLDPFMPPAGNYLIVRADDG